MAEWPALMVAPDMFRQTTNLNGRRWAGSALLEAWAQFLGEGDLHLACAQPQYPAQLSGVLDQAGHRGQRHVHGLLHPHPYPAIGGLFIPDPNLGRWSRWRARCGSQHFSLIGQIHTLNTSSAVGMIESLVTEPVQPWDALICSSSAGRDVVNAILDDRETWMQRRFGPHQPLPRPQLPVIPLPVAVNALIKALPERNAARKQLGLPPEASVCLWLGRLSLFTKLDPWTQYRVLEAVARQLPQELWLIECGPDDSEPQRDHLAQLRALCPNVRFLRLGGSEAVPEEGKHQALAAADVAISLVDNCQETFGLSLVEAMAAGLPMLVSDWDGYRNLVRQGVDGFLVPSRWLSDAHLASEGLAWAQELGLQTYPGIAGSLAQLVVLDTNAAEAMLLSLLQNPSMARAMGRQGRQQMRERCEAQQVMRRYDALFADLAERRAQAQPQTEPAAAAIGLNPVRLFSHYASLPTQASGPTPTNRLDALPDVVRQGRLPLWDEVLRACREEDSRERLLQALPEKHL